MQFTIIVSKKDKAGMNIAEELKRGKIPFNIVEEETIYEDNLDKKIDADFYIFATEHCAVKESKTLSIHAPGNWRKADFGGKEKEICPTSCFLMKKFFILLNEEIKKANSEYKLTMEVTHHGPIINKPCFFIEIGTTLKEWQDKNAGKIIAETLKKGIRLDNLNKDKDKFIPVLAIGGPHYCPNFNKIQIQTNYAIGHIIPEYSLPLTQEMLDEAINKTQEKIEIAILDWKGCGKSEERQKLIELLEKNNLKILRTNQIEK